MKAMRKILMAALTLAMVLGMSVTVYASQVVSTVSKISAPKTATVWTNPVDEAEQAITATFSYAGDAELAQLVAVSKDRGIANVKSISKYTGDNGKKYVKVVLDPIKNGKTTITIYDKNKTKVKGTTTVTVKTYAEGITFGTTSSVKNDNTVDVVANGKLQLGAVVTNANASSKTLKYKKVSGSKAITVDSKGNVSVAKKAADGDKAEITITSADGNTNAVKTVTVNVLKNEVKGSIAFMKESTSTKLAYGKLNKSNAVGLKSNDSSEFKTYQLVATNNTIPNSALCFTSSNTAVATVDKNTGLIKGISAGKAVINVTSKTGAKVSAKVNVTVTTDVEALNLTTNKNQILANNKDTAALKLACNSASGAKNAKYTIMLNGATTKKATVDKKGNFKASKAGDYTITAKAGDVTSVVEIKAIAPTTTIKVVDLGSSIKKGVLNITRATQDDVDNLVYKVDCSKNGDDDAIEWSSSNTAVATVENGVIKPVANGKAKITVKALDGTNKSASITVNVKTKAYDITSDRVVVENIDGVDTNVVYVATKLNGETPVNTSVKLATEVAAKTNANASDKTIKYYNAAGTKVITSATVTEDGVKVIAKSNAAEYPVLIKKLVSAEIAKDFDMGYNEEFPEYIKVGDKIDTSVTVSVKDGEEGKVATNLSAVTYKSSNTKILTVDSKGNVVAKATGAATVKATFKNPYDATKNLVVEKSIFVGSKDSTIKAALDATFASVLKEENRDWTGIKTTFSSKTGTFTLNVLDPKQNVTELKDTGLTPSAISACLALDAKKMPIQAITVCDELGNEINTIDREMVLSNGLHESLKAIITEAIGDNGVLENWVGTNYTIKITTLDNVYPEISHDIEYSAVVTMSDAIQKQLADINIEAAIKAATDAEVLPEGISSIDYNEATRTAVVYVNDPDMTFEAARVAETREALVEKLAGAFEGVSFVDYVIDIPNVGTATKVVSDEDGNKPVNVINDLLDTYADKLVEKNIVTYADADGTVATAQVTYKIGNMTFARDYTIVFAIDKDVFADKVNDAILANIESANAALEGQAVINRPADGSNEITVGILDKEVTPFDIKNADIKDATKSFVQDACIDTNATGTAMMNGKVVTLTKDDYDMLFAVSVLRKLNVAKLGDVVGKTAYVKFPVVIGNTKVTVTYTVKFELVKTDTSSDEKVSEEGQGAVVDEETVVDEDATIDETTEEINDEEVVDEEVITEEEVEEIISETEAEEVTTEATEEVVDEEAIVEE